MAFAVRLTGISEVTGRQAFSMEPNWWSAKELKNDPRMKETVTDGYLDYRMMLSVDETRAIHERFKQTAGAGVFRDKDWQNIIRPMMEELDEVFGARAAEFSQFEICVFEWESGLG